MKNKVWYFNPPPPSKKTREGAIRTVRQCLDEELPKIPYELRGLRKVLPAALLLLLSCRGGGELRPAYQDFVGETVCNLDTRSNSTLPGYAVSCITFRKDGTGEIEYHTGTVLEFTYEFTADELCITYPSLTDCAPFRVSENGYLEWKGDFFFVR